MVLKMKNSLNKNLITLVLGGCRSGKSSHALELSNQMANAGDRKIFMATSVPTDQEMEKRVNKHKRERGEDWITAEVPVDLPSQIMDLSSDSEIILVDCLTLWVSNLLFHGFDEDAVVEITGQLQDSLQRSSSPVFLVSNEVGMGIVPENGLAREFRDMAGYVNQKIAQTADQVIYTLAGIPWRIKPAG